MDVSNCKKEWTRKFMRQQLTDVFVNGDYKKHLAEMYLEHEKSLLPATQEKMEIDKKEKEFASFMGNERKTLNNDILEVDDWYVNELDRFRNELNRQRREKKELLRNIFEIKMAEYRQENGLDIVDLNTEKSRHKNKFIQKCTNDGCRGFLGIRFNSVGRGGNTNTCAVDAVEPDNTGKMKKWLECGMCESKYCYECKEKYEGDAHTCNPDILASAKLIMLETRNCPSCPYRGP